MKIIEKINLSPIFMWILDFGHKVDFRMAEIQHLNSKKN